MTDSIGPAPVRAPTGSKAPLRRDSTSGRLETAAKESQADDDLAVPNDGKTSQALSDSPLVSADDCPSLDDVRTLGNEMIGLRLAAQGSGRDPLIPTTKYPHIHVTDNSIVYSTSSVSGVHE